MAKIIVKLIRQIEAEPEEVGRISYSEEEGLKWIYFKGHIGNIINKPVFFRDKEINPKENPKEWINLLFTKYQNQYLSATRPEEEE